MTTKKTTAKKAAKKTTRRISAKTAVQTNDGLRSVFLRVRNQLLARFAPALMRQPNSKTLEVVEVRAKAIIGYVHENAPNAPLEGVESFATCVAGAVNMNDDGAVVAFLYSEEAKLLLQLLVFGDDVSAAPAQAGAGSADDK